MSLSNPSKYLFTFAVILTEAPATSPNLPKPFLKSPQPLFVIVAVGPLGVAGSPEFGMLKFGCLPMLPLLTKLEPDKSCEKSK